MALALALSLGGCTTARVGVKATSTAAKGAVKVTTSVTKTVL